MRRACRVRLCITLSQQDNFGVNRAVNHRHAGCAGHRTPRATPLARLRPYSVSRSPARFTIAGGPHDRSRSSTTLACSRAALDAVSAVLSSSVQITSSGSSRLPATQSGTLRLARDKGTIRTVVQSDPADTPTIIRRTPHAADARCAPGARNSLRQIPTSHIATLAHSTLRPAYKHRFTPLTYCALALMAGC